MLNSNVWANPNNFFMSFRCTRIDHARNFIEKGQLKFNTPQSWVEWEMINGKGRGDLLEGTFARFNVGDVERGTEIYNRYK